jgi:hypothetical protein
MVVAPVPESGLAGRRRDSCINKGRHEYFCDSTVHEHTTPRHVPAKILTVADIPRTKSGKLVELAVRNVVHDHEHAARSPCGIALLVQSPSP